MDNAQLKRYARLYAAPAILIIVASLQNLRAHTQHLTPWKGGGFGMFSTVDAPGARFLRVYLITDDGEIPVLLPDYLARDERFVRVMPVERNVVALASDLASETWIFTGEGSGEPVNPIDSEGETALGDEGNPSEEAGPDTPGDDAPPPDEESLVQPLDGDSTPGARVLYDFEPEPPAELVVPFEAVRVEVWRHNFDSAARRVEASKFSEVTFQR